MNSPAKRLSSVPDMGKYAPRRDKRGRLVCTCGGYWFPHRKGGGACDYSKTRDMHIALRYGT